MKIAIDSDHRGFDLKKRLIPFVQNLGHEVVDVGRFPRRARFLRAHSRQEPAHREGDEVHDSVPVDLERTEAAERSNLECDLVEAGVLDHVRRSLVIRA